MMPSDRRRSGSLESSLTGGSTEPAGGQRGPLVIAVYSGRIDTQCGGMASTGTAGNDRLAQWRGYCFRDSERSPVFHLFADVGPVRCARYGVPAVS